MWNLTSTLWPAQADTSTMTWLYSLVWCALALGLLVFDRRFWTVSPRQQSATRAGAAAGPQEHLAARTGDDRG